jgi:predicted signal transduction protein with EAL and GGDEF domain
LRSCLRAVDIAARFGGDEFAELLTDPVPEDLLVVTRRIQGRVSAPLLLGDQEISVTASIGIATADTGYEDPEDVLRDADIAMYRAKEAERGSACLFDPAMHQRALDRLRIRTAVVIALDNHEFVVHYQPIIDFEDTTVTKFEALVRWQHPTRGLLGPGEFLPSMEGNATIVTLGRQILDDVCAQIAQWRQDGQHTVAVSVNVSHREFWATEYLTNLTQTLDRHHVPPKCLSLELTEGIIMNDPDEARARMAQLHALGVELHIDDFGTGQSSLNLLRTFPVDTLKIDGSFIRELTTVAQATALVRAIIAMGAALGMSVTAECVETSEQAAALHSLGCNTAQGWLYAKAMPADQAGRILGTALHQQPQPERDQGPGRTQRGEAGTSRAGNTADA